MGKAHALQKRYNRMYQRKMRTPSLPKDVQLALTQHGYTVKKATNLKQFYSKLGLSSNPNDTAQIGFNDKLGQLRKELAEQKPKPPKKEDPDAIPFSEIMESMPHGRNYQAKLSENEFKILAHLETRYGDDYELMSYDRRHNPQQWTIAQLEKKMAIYHRELTELAEEKKRIEEQLEKQKKLAEEEEEEVDEGNNDDDEDQN